MDFWLSNQSDFFYNCKSYCRLYNITSLLKTFLWPSSPLRIKFRLFTKASKFLCNLASACLWPHGLVSLPCLLYSNNIGSFFKVHQGHSCLQSFVLAVSSVWTLVGFIHMSFWRALLWTFCLKLLLIIRYFRIVTVLIKYLIRQWEGDKCLGSNNISH